MYADAKARDTYQQRQDDADNHQNLVLFIAAEGGVQGHGIGRVTAGEGIALRRYIIDIRAPLHGLETLDARVIEVRSAPDEDVLDHGVEGDAYQHVQSDIFAVFFFPTPVQKAQHRDTYQLFTHFAEHGRDRSTDRAELRLDPLHQRDFPFKIKCITHYPLSLLTDSMIRHQEFLI